MARLFAIRRLRFFVINFCLRLFENCLIDYKLVITDYNNNRDHFCYWLGHRDEQDHHLVVILKIKIRSYKKCDLKDQDCDSEDQDHFTFSTWR